MLKSRGFKRPELPPRSRPALVLRAEPARAVISVSGARPIVAVMKRVYVRSRKLMAAYRKIACQHCGAEDGTVCGAHSNWSIHGKAKSKKADDNRAASLCFTCHGDLDQGSRLTERQRQAMWWAAHVKTVWRLVFLGLWPDDVQVPSTHEYPKEWT